MRLARSAGVRRALALVAAGLLSTAAAPDANFFETEYLITGEVEPAGLNDHAMKVGDVVFRQKLSFANLSVADKALKIVGGEEVVPSGEQYFRAASEGAEVWCTANMRMPKDGLAAKVVGRVYPQYCIFDADKDGAFESFFKKQRTIEVLPNVRGNVPSGLRAIEKIRLTPVEPLTLRTGYYMGVAFAGFRGKERAPQFAWFAGSEHGLFELEDWIAGGPGERQQIRIADATIEISTTPDGVTGRVIKPFKTKLKRFRGTDCGWINGC